jgi:protein SCO1/2
VTSRLVVLAFAAVAGLAAPAIARDSDPPASLYRFEAKLTNQDGKAHGLDVDRGHPVLVTMFYGSCQASCPLIIDTLRVTEKALPEKQRANLRVLMISFDPRRDTPAALADIARTRHIDTTRWTLAHAEPADVRTLAALLDVQYRQLPSGEFNHSTSIVLLSATGETLASTHALGHADETLIKRLAP